MWQKRKLLLCLILMIITMQFVNKIQRSMKRKLHQFISSEKRLTCALLAAKFGVRIIKVQIIEVRIIEDTQ